MTSPAFYMPTRFDSAAPRFDDRDPTTLLPFFDDLDTLFARAHISDDQEKKTHARRYTSDCAYDVFAAIPQFAPPATYSDFKDAILNLWPGSRNCDRVRRSDLEELVEKRRSAAITSEEELAEFFRAFLAISEQLIALRRLCALEQRRAFATAFDASLWTAISRRLDIIDCDRDPELPSAIRDVYEAARHVLHSRSARALARTASPVIVIPAPAKSAPSPAIAPPPPVALAPVVPLVAPPRPVAALAPRPPIFAPPPPSLLARPALTTAKPALAPIATTAPRFASHAPSPKPAPPPSIAPAAPLRIAPRFPHSLPHPAALAHHLLAPAPALRQRSLEESAKILEAFTWHPPRRDAPAHEPAQDSEEFANVLATLGDPFEAFAPPPNRVARAARVYSMYPPLPVSFDEFLYGTAPATPAAPSSASSCPTSPTPFIAASISPISSPPCLPIAYLPPSSPLFASLPKSNPRPRVAATVHRAAPAPSLRTVSLPSLPTIHPTSLSLSELLGVAPGVRDLLRALLDALEPAPRELRPLSHPRDAFDPGGVALALRSVPPTLSRLRCAHECPRVVSFALCVAHPRYELVPAFIRADPALRPRQSSSPRLSSAPSHSMPARLASPASSLMPAPPPFSLSLAPAPSPALRSSSQEPALHSSTAKPHPDPASAPRHFTNHIARPGDASATPRPMRPSPPELVLRSSITKPRPEPAFAPRNTPDDISPPCATSATPRPPRPSSVHPANANTRATTPAHHAASRRRVDSLGQRAIAIANTPATSPAHPAAPHLAQTTPRRRTDSPEPRDSARPPSPCRYRVALCDPRESIPPPASRDLPRDSHDRVPRARPVIIAPRSVSHIALAIHTFVATALALIAVAFTSFATAVPHDSPPRARPRHRPPLVASRSLVVPAAPRNIRYARNWPCLHNVHARSRLAVRALHLCDVSLRTSAALSAFPLAILQHPRWRLSDIATSTFANATSRPRLRYLGDPGLALVAAPRQTPRVRSRFRKASLCPALTPASRLHHRHRFHRVIARAPALRNRV